MIDFARLRQSMVDSQVRPNAVTDPRIIAAMLELPRERFVPADRAGLAYLDDDLSLREAGLGRPARYLVEPMVFAKLVQALELAGEERVLDVACGTGYSAAVLARLARQVIAIDDEDEFVRIARTLLSDLNVRNIDVIRQPLAEGAREWAPYDAILVNGSIEIVPDGLLSQLGDNGRLVAVIRRGALGRATLFYRTGATISQRPLFDASVPLLPGFAAPPAFVF